MSNQYKKLFDNIFKIPSNRPILITTVDHPYSSPPIRLTETYIRLKEYHKQYFIIPIIWDISIPQKQTKRLDVYFDTGLLVNQKNAIIYNLGKKLYKQKPKCPNFQNLEKTLKRLLKQLKVNKYLSHTLSITKIITNYHQIIKVYEKAMTVSPLNSANYYTQIQLGISELIGTEEEVSLHFKNTLSLSQSNKFKTYIIQALKFAHKTKYSPFAHHNKQMFTKSFIHNTNKSHVFTYDEVIHKLELTDVYFSLELFFWGLTMANIHHFGNDYSMFSRFEKIIGKSNKHLQLTKHNDDGFNLCEFIYDQAFVNMGKKFIRPKCLTKSSRINTFTALYILLGSQLTTIINTYKVNPSQFKLKKFSYEKTRK